MFFIGSRSGGISTKAVALGAAILAAGIGSVLIAKPHPLNVGVMEARKECGHDSPHGELQLPGPLTNVPELHDCQRFIRFNWLARHVKWIKPTYDSLVAIYVSQHIGEVFQVVTQTQPSILRQLISDPDILGGATPVDVPIGNVVAPNLPPGIAVPIAVIYSYGKRYAPLGIEPHFNCLYAFVDNNTISAAAPLPVRALMVPVGDTDAQCSTNREVSQLTGTELRVTRRAHPAYAADEDYPPVTRWHWDARAWLQYIGIKCGAAWCEIGPPQFTPPEDPPATMQAAVLTKFGSRFAIKGWYDDQWLAYPKGEGVLASKTRGYIIPDRNLATASFGTGTWSRVAYLALEKDIPSYKSKLNVSESSFPDHVSEVHLCRETSETPNACGAPANAAETAAAADADPVWWAVIKAPDGTQIFKQVDFQPYAAGLTVHPGTVRWRWWPKDETGWIWCPEGCCQICQGPSCT